MKLDELRRRSAQRRATQGQQDVKQMIDIFGNEKTQEVFLKFTYLTDHIKMTAQQALDHGYKVLSAAVVCGAKIDMKLLDTQIEHARQAVAMDQKKLSEPRGGH